MRLKDKINRMESGELLDAEEMSQQTEAHGNRLRNQAGKTAQNLNKNKKNDQKNNI